MFVFSAFLCWLKALGTCTRYLYSVLNPASRFLLRGTIKDGKQTTILHRGYIYTCIYSQRVYTYDTYVYI